MKNSTAFNNYLCRLQSEIFYLASLTEYDFPSLIILFMKSDIAFLMDSAYSNIQTRSAISILNMFIKENITGLKKATVKYNEEACRWLGYFYRYWQLETKEPSKRIVNKLTPLNGLKKYFSYHQMDFLDAIEIANMEYNLKRNAHRKYEIKNKEMNNEEILKKYSKESFAKTILFKYFKNESIKTLTEEYSNKSHYDLISPNYDTGIVVKTLKSFDSDSIISLYNKENEEMMFSKLTADNSFLFIFLTKQLDDEEFLNKSINKLNTTFISNRSKFDCIFVYVNGVLYQINRQYGVIKFYIGVTNTKIL